ncbi:hypothetical protein BOVATA_035390 [Babesia ovata]|uniref:Uncharacterized protein n=1 Tax=Babesia ovata TaxID=189622 RepID=A0A2H6KGD0_9APIC|nr:uncharacterized protein BOVATA_035390 [Babesia ovata]GBE62046.1 hypothetical protein BOVATA_035390 [Babesia ovata]
MQVVRIRQNDLVSGPHATFLSSVDNSLPCEHVAAAAVYPVNRYINKSLCARRQPELANRGARVFAVLGQKQLEFRAFVFIDFPRNLDFDTDDPSRVHEVRVAEVEHRELVGRLGHVVSAIHDVVTQEVELPGCPALKLIRVEDEIGNARGEIFRRVFLVAVCVHELRLLPG